MAEVKTEELDYLRKSHELRLRELDQGFGVVSPSRVEDEERSVKVLSWSAIAAIAAMLMLYVTVRANDLANHKEDVAAVEERADKKISELKKDVKDALKAIKQDQKETNKKLDELKDSHKENLDRAIDRLLVAIRKN